MFLMILAFILPSPHQSRLHSLRIYTFHPWYTSKRQFCNHDDRESGYCDDNDDEDARLPCPATYIYKHDRRRLGLNRY